MKRATKAGVSHKGQSAFRFVFDELSQIVVVAAAASFTAGCAGEKLKVDGTETRERIEREILEIERETMAAIEKKDAGALSLVFAEDFVHRTPGGEELSKAAFLENIASIPFEILSVRGEALKVSAFGETAVLTGVQKATVRTADGKEEVSRGAFTDVFHRRGGRWLMVLAYSVELPADDGGQPR